jgi:hypothetical protein
MDCKDCPNKKCFHLSKPASTMEGGKDEKAGESRLTERLPDHTLPQTSRQISSESR